MLKLKSNLNELDQIKQHHFFFFYLYIKPKSTISNNIADKQRQEELDGLLDYIEEVVNKEINQDNEANDVPDRNTYGIASLSRFGKNPYGITGSSCSKEKLIVIVSSSDDELIVIVGSSNDELIVIIGSSDDEIQKNVQKNTPKSKNIRKE
ncbi:hypothetical protein RclHR1_14440010 [Rhizophagus clarus]|uniref:Uncharacterized protein n=1 Tax=Rhizophagus clarus TaxID=94130 RepID=A0A2Z6QT92_9GLOM|nr:hypothetical protein RclHR1_14440010 [Rhizophagus clarus]